MGAIIVLRYVEMVLFKTGSSAMMEISCTVVDATNASFNVRMNVHTAQEVYAHIAMT